MKNSTKTIFVVCVALMAALTFAQDPNQDEPVKAIPPATQVVEPGQGMGQNQSQSQSQTTGGGEVESQPVGDVRTDTQPVAAESQVSAEAAQAAKVEITNIIRQGPIYVNRPANQARLRELRKLIADHERTRGYIRDLRGEVRKNKSDQARTDEAQDQRIDGLAVRVQTLEGSSPVLNPSHAGAGLQVMPAPNATPEKPMYISSQNLVITLLVLGLVAAIVYIVMQRRQGQGVRSRQQLDDGPETGSYVAELLHGLDQTHVNTHNQRVFGTVRTPSGRISFSQQGGGERSVRPSQQDSAA